MELCPMCGADVAHCPKCGVPLVDRPEELAEAERRILARPSPQEKKARGWSWGTERTVLTAAGALNAILWLLLAAAGIYHVATRVPGEKLNPLLNPFVLTLAAILGVAQLFICSRLNQYYATKKPPDDADDAD